MIGNSNGDPAAPPFVVQETHLGPDYSLVIARCFGVSQARAEAVSELISAMDGVKVERALAETTQRFRGRHSSVEQTWLEHAARAAAYVPETAAWSDPFRKLLGACFTAEYSVAAAALFNPSLCLFPEPDAEEERTGRRRAVLSVRATGEGHISSLMFRGVDIEVDGSVRIEDPVTPLSTGVVTEGTADEGYWVCFPPKVPLAARVIFPYASDEVQGLEDARFVRYEDDAGAVTYFATVTGYDGRNITPKMIETVDFRCFRVFPCTGQAARNKDMALFPRPVGGRYAMVSRQDGRSIFIMYSQCLHRWDRAELLRVPHEEWEMVQIGSCGSPIELEEGWLLPIHGVAPFRRYAIGFYLLDLDDPGRVIAATRTPLLEPQENERDGYVPNVVYSCGGVLHNGRLVLPYAVNDTAVRVAGARVEDILAQLTPV